MFWPNQRKKKKLNWTYALCIRSVESKPLNPQGSPRTVDPGSLNPSPPFLVFHLLLFFFFFLAEIGSLWDLNSPTRNWTRALSSERAEPWPLAHLGSSFFSISFLAFLFQLKKDAQLESCELSFICGKMRTAAWEAAPQIALRDCSKEAVGEDYI